MSDVFFLCLDQPIVIKTIARIIVIGCSIANNLSFICHTSAPFVFKHLYQGDIKYQPNLLIIECAKQLK